MFTYSQNKGCHLEILGPDCDDTLNNREEDIILGIATDGESITLLDCSRTRRHNNYKGVETVRYRIQFALLGHHFAKKEEILFDRLKASLADLGTWAGIYGFTHLNVRQKKI